MQDHLFFVTASYLVAAFVLAAIFAVTIYRFYAVKRRLAALTSPSK